jgi:aspartyl-tRNA(Asn)/glutamyl-tRNA(Gln) amidotransferase subunit A
MNGRGTFSPSRRRFLEASAGALTSALAVDLKAAELPLQPAPETRATDDPLDLARLTIVQASARLRARTLSSVELTQATLDRIARVEPRVGAFITIVADRALDAARQADREIAAGRYRGPLHGIPFGVKDTYYTRGIRTTAGSPVLDEFVPDSDAAIVERMKTAGAVLVGKLKLPEFSFGGTTPGCHNPWDLSRNAGGSSGGPAAALAASMLMATMGGDTSGSIRNPASTCGVVGLKPTFGLVSRHAVVPISWTLDHLGPMATTVEDTAILLKALAGHDARDRFSANVPVADYPALLNRPLKGLRVGVLAASELAGFHRDVTRAFADAIKVFETLGAQLREVTFPARMRTSGSAQEIIRIAEAATYHRQYLTSAAAAKYISDVGQSGTAVSRVRTTVEAGSLLTAAQYLQAQRARTLFLADTRTVYAEIDALLSPTMPAPAGVAATPRETFRSWWNLSGFPALSLPCGFSVDPPGLPIGLQISGKPFADVLVLALGHAYERATDWHTRRPPL